MAQTYIEAYFSRFKAKPRMANRSGSQTDQIQDDHNTILEAELLIILLWNYTDLSPLYTYIYIYIYIYESHYRSFIAMLQCHGSHASYLDFEQYGCQADSQLSAPPICSRHLTSCYHKYLVLF